MTDDPSDFAPLAHALSRLVASDNKTVSALAARCVKWICTDAKLCDAAVNTGAMASALLAAATRWADDGGLLHEVLGALQNMCLVGKGVAECTGTGMCVPVLLAGMACRIPETRRLALNTVCNLHVEIISSFSCCVFSQRDRRSDCFRAIFLAPTRLSHSDSVHLVAWTLIPPLVERLATATCTPADHVLCAAAIANAARHPVLSAACIAAGAVDALTSGSSKANEPFLWRLVRGDSVGNDGSDVSVNPYQLARDRLVAPQRPGAANAASELTFTFPFRPQPPRTCGRCCRRCSWTTRFFLALAIFVGMFFNPVVPFFVLLAVVVVADRRRPPTKAWV